MSILAIPSPQMPVSPEGLAEKITRIIAWTSTTVESLPLGASAMQVCLDLDVEDGGMETITFTAEPGEGLVYIGHPGREVFAVNAAQFMEGAA
jgi:hypothetical protein